MWKLRNMDQEMSLTAVRRDECSSKSREDNLTERKMCTLEAQLMRFHKGTTILAVLQ